MIFQRRAKKCDYNFYICNEKIDIILSYTYLGTQISSTGTRLVGLSLAYVAWRLKRANKAAKLRKQAARSLGERQRSIKPPSYAGYTVTRTLKRKGC